MNVVQHNPDANIVSSVDAATTPRAYAWLIFAITFALLLSDYMSRQVLNAVFPYLKAEWGLSDERLGMLSGVVSLAVGVLALPLSLLADRWGRIKSLVLMAALWSVATLGCALARGFEDMLMARLAVGVGEAAYGSVGLAVLLGVFPARQRATITGAFLAGGMIGSMLGISLGGIVAANLGWRAAFGSMALFGLVLTICYPLIVQERRIASASLSVAHAGPASAGRPPLRELIASRSVLCAYLGSGVQLFVSGALLAWLPSYLNRSYDMPVAKASALAAIFVLSSAAGMTLCGHWADRIGRDAPERKLALAITYCLACFCLLSLAFHLPVGTAQMTLIAVGMFLGAGTVGPAGAMVANLTPVPIHASAFAILALANNVLGLAPGPWITGKLADAYGLPAALQVVPFASVLSAAVFALARYSYQEDLRQFRQRRAAL